MFIASDDPERCMEYTIIALVQPYSTIKLATALVHQRILARRLDGTKKVLNIFK